MDRAQRPSGVAMATRPISIEKLIALLTPELAAQFIEMIQNIVDSATLKDITDAIERNDPAGAFAAVGFTRAAMAPFLDAVDRAFVRGGVATTESFPKRIPIPGGGRVSLHFDARNPRAEAWLREHSAQMVSRLTTEAQENVRITLERGMLNGDNPRKVALDLVGRVDPSSKKRIGGVVGLAANQEAWSANTRRDLEQLSPRYFTRKLRDKRYDKIVQAAIDSGKKLPQDTIDKLMTNYNNRALKYRGESIGRTEAIQSLNHAEWESYMQAVDQGALRRQDVTRHWDSTGDDRVRWSHSSMDKTYQEKGVGLEEPFKSPSGALMMFPGDTSLGAGAKEVVMCRCRVRLKVDWLAKAVEEA